MPKYEVNIGRCSWRYHTFTVEADNISEAEDKAHRWAGDHDFNEDSEENVEYETTGAFEEDDPDMVKCPWCGEANNYSKGEEANDFSEEQPFRLVDCHKCGYRFTATKAYDGRAHACES